MTMRHTLRAALFAMALTPTACGITDVDFEDEGVVRFLDIEGGCWVIDVGEVRLEPINLEDPFRIDGLLVSFQADDRPDLASICQVGRLVELKSIRVRDAASS